ncbi:17434_t:CDS:2 [Cetraspora pellucida]|uniref:17434_t:CDS:1 n=1 Tax=Cetraspora pellucida TaxID=1433469 RepID=A0A9N9GD70_9GLOM|nr:17434_t:CDS:2 [Cetraspora pellucida]
MNNIGTYKIKKKQIKLVQKEERQKESKPRRIRKKKSKLVSNLLGELSIVELGELIDNYSEILIP